MDDNVIAPMKIMWYITQGKLKASSEECNQLIDIFNQNVISEKNVFGLGYKRLYLKYDRPRRLERNKIRNKKLSEWSGRKTNDYTGIAENLQSARNLAGSHSQIIVLFYLRF